MSTDRIGRVVLSGGGVYGGGGEGIDATAWLLNMQTKARAGQECDCVLCTNRESTHLPSLSYL